MNNTVVYFSQHTPKQPRTISAMGFDKATPIEGIASLAKLEAENIFTQLNERFTSDWGYVGDETLHGRNFHRFKNDKDERNIWIQIGLNAAIGG